MGGLYPKAFGNESWSEVPEESVVIDISMVLRSPLEARWRDAGEGFAPRDRVSFIGMRAPASLLWPPG